MLLQRQYIILSYFKNLGVGPASVWTSDPLRGKPVLIQLS